MQLYMALLNQLLFLYSNTELLPRLREITLDFGILCDRYRDQLEDLAAIVRGDKPNDQDYDHDLKVHELTLKACGVKG